MRKQRQWYNNNILSKSGKVQSSWASPTTSNERHLGSFRLTIADTRPWASQVYSSALVTRAPHRSPRCTAQPRLQPRLSLPVHAPETQAQRSCHLSRTRYYLPQELENTAKDPIDSRHKRALHMHSCSHISMHKRLVSSNLGIKSIDDRAHRSCRTYPHFHSRGSKGNDAGICGDGGR